MLIISAMFSNEMLSTTVRSGRNRVHIVHSRSSRDRCSEPVRDLCVSPDSNACDRSLGDQSSAGSPARSREVILADRRARRLAERLAKPTFVNSDACCRTGRAGLAYESAVLGNRAELIPCSDITLAEHLALLMAMHDAESRLSGRVVFRVDSSAVIDQLCRGYPDLDEAKRQIGDLLDRHPEWDVVLVERQRNWAAHNLAKRPLRGDDA